MKKIATTGFSLIVLLFCLVTSCDKEDPIDPLVGAWEYTETIDGSTITITLTFNTDKTGSIKMMFLFEGIPESEVSNFTYSTNANTLTMIMEDETSEVSYSISGNKLTITEDGESIVFTRK